MSKELEKKETTVSERFTIAVMKEVAGNVGVAEFTPYQKKLSQHLFIKIDATLNELEAKRLKVGKPGSPIAWENMNMQKLAIDVMHRVELGLDALIPNHISPIPYFNSKLKKYDLDLRIGYEGKEYYRREVAIEKPVDIIKELVYKNDTFKPLKRTVDRSVESYKFDIPNPFDRGEIIGGFSYIKFEDPSKNILVLVTDADFKKSESKGNATFWKNHPVKMKFKTLITRTMDHVPIDPRKINASFTAVENDDATDRIIVEAEINEKANTGEILEMAQREWPQETELPREASKATAKHPAYDLCIEKRGCVKFEKVSDCPNANVETQRVKCVHGMELEKKKTTDDLGPVPCPNDNETMTPWSVCAGCSELEECPVR